MTTVRRGIPALFLGALLSLLLLLCVTPAAHADGNVSGNTVEKLQAAVDSGASTFTLDDNMLIADNVFINGMQGDGLTLIIPTGKTLTITNGIVELSGLELNGGTLNLHGGIFRVNRSFTYDGGSIHVHGCWNLFPAADVFALNYKNIFSFERDNGDSTNLLFPVTSESEFASAVNQINTRLTSEQDKYYFGHIKTEARIDLTSSYTLTHRTDIQLHEDLVITENGAISYARVGGGVTLNQKIGNNGGTDFVVLGTLGTNSVTVNSDCHFIAANDGLVNMNQLNLGGTVRCEGGAKLNVYGKLEHQGGTIEAYDNSIVSLPGRDLTSDEQLAAIFFPVNVEHPTNEAFVQRMYSAGNDESLNAALGAAANPPAQIGALIDVNYEWTPAGNFQAPEMTDIIINNKLTVNGTYSLPQQGNLVANTGTIIVNGTLDGTGDSAGSVVINSGGTLYAKDGGTVELNNLRLDGTAYAETNARFRVYGAMTELNESLRPNGVLYVADGAAVQIEARDLDPQALSSWVLFDGGNNSVIVRATVWSNDVFDGAANAVKSVPERFVPRLYLTDDITLSKNYDLLDPYTELAISHRGSLTVNSGVQLSVCDIVNMGAPIAVNGTLLCTGDITMSANGESLPSLSVDTNGNLMGPCRIYVNNMGESASDCISGIGDLTEGLTNDTSNTVFYSKGGFFDALEAACQGLVSVDEFDLRDLGNFEILRNLTVPKTLTLKAPNAAIVVPQDVTLMVNGAIIMTERVDVVGTMQVQRPFDPEEEVTAFLGCGTLNVSGALTLAAPADITTLNINNTWVTLVDMPYGAAADTHWNTIKYTGDIGRVGVKLFHHVNSLEGLADALSKVNDNTNDYQEDHIRLFMQNDWTISSDYVIPANANVHVHEGLTVSDGATLTLYGHLVSEEGQMVTINGCVALYGDGHLISGTDGTITVNGSLVNNARVTAQRHKNGTGAELIIKGGYSGTGNIVVTDASNPDSYISGMDLSRFVKDAQPNWVTYQPHGLIVDLALPAELTEIESEAFAGGAFRSVYIPAGVETIAADSFGSRTGLVIYGYHGSQAETVFGQKPGFLFVTLP
ncbi:MAG: hypothetical protein IJV51_06760 [Oscillospiraceae bacterium]|nr:hypothetical protein [Oscillospiraceae bacterium]